MIRFWRLLAAAVVVAGTVTPALAVSSAAAASGDITAAVLANRDVVLSGDSVIHIPAGTHTYTGVISGTGTLRLSGRGTLVLTRDSTFTLPPARRHQRVSIPGGNHPYVVITNPDPPTVTVDAGATLQYGTSGGTGLIGKFPYNTPGYQQNQDNIRVNGTLRLSLTRTFNLGIISGSGLITQPRNMWGTAVICGTNPFSGVFDNGTGMAFATINCSASLPSARKVLNQGSWIIDTPLNHTVVQRQNFYNRAYGSDVNVHSRPGSKVILTGSYSWSNEGPDTNPSLSDPALNWRPVPHQLNKRGTNIEGANVQWGDGTTHAIFMPGTAQTVYINLHANRQRSTLAFDYNGPVTLGAPIGGGKYHDTLSTPGAGDTVIKGTRGNYVTFAAIQFYDGSTTIEPNATLRLGSGTAAGDGGLYTRGTLDKVVNDGSLVIHNTKTRITLPPVSGKGSLTQSGAATTVTAASYTGRTRVARGTLRVAGTSLATSSGVALTSRSSVLDLRAANEAKVKKLNVVKGARILLAPGAHLTVGSQSSATTGSHIVVGGITFAVTRTNGGYTVLTATTTIAGARAATSASEPAQAVGAGAASSRSATTTEVGVKPGQMVRTSSNSSLWPTAGLTTVALVGAAGAFVVRRSRSRS
jgi:autotransporter-associated beta strand protein